MSRRGGLLAILLAAACCSKSEVKGGGSTEPATPTKPSFSLIGLAEMRGQVGPCGCTTDPLGDISRTARLVEDARAAGPLLVVDAGSLQYSKSPVPEHLAAQEELKSDLLVRTYRESLKVGAIGLGPADLARGADHVKLPRQAVNLGQDGLSAEAPKVVTVGTTKVGVFGVIAADAFAIKVADPVSAAKTAVADLKKQGAQVIVALVQAGSKKDAVKLVRDTGGIDLAIGGLGLEAPEPERVEIDPTKVGDGWLVIPANRGQVISRLDVTVRGPGAFANAVGEAGAVAKLAALDKQLAALDVDLAAFAADKDADPAFVKQKQAERVNLSADRAKLAANPGAVPATGNYFTLEQVKIGKTLACDPKVQSDVTAFYLAAGKANVEAAAKIAVAPPPKGVPAYAGMASCDDCHSEAVEFWKKTVHAQAWQTLVERGQQFDFECIGCHVTGWDKPGGANLAHNETLRDVQCEVCHGPGSFHVAKGGDEKPPAIKRAPAADLCATQCHTKEHSDTFALEPYLRDVLGPGHGEKMRKELGDGPTGGQLRKAALAKAGRLGAGCVR